GQSYEAGMKVDLAGGALRSSLAAYQITKQNLLQPDPAAPTTQFIAVGEVQSRGIELEFTGDLAENWVMMVNYSYNETEVTEDGRGTGSFSGGGFGVPTRGQFVNAPRNMAGLWTRYDFPGINSSIAGGLYHVDDRVNFDLGKVPAYTIYDMSWQTDWKNLNFQLNVKNLLDKKYAVSGWSGGNFPGEPRTFIFQVSVDFGDSLKFGN
ncbi:MAG TPA: TonB-dependent receptor, partial [Vicinamibacterales bacterium]